MERLTIPDKPIEGGMSRAIIDTKEIRDKAMTIYWALKRYEDTGLTPEQIGEIDRLYADKCKELAEAEPYIRLAEKLNICDLVRENKRLSDKILYLEAEAKLVEMEVK